MANVASVGGAIGALNPDYRTASSDFNVNTTVIGTDGFTYRYVEAGGVIAASQTDISVSAAGQATDGSGTYIGTTAFADNEWGWVKSVTQVANAAA